MMRPILLIVLVILVVPLATSSTSLVRPLRDAPDHVQWVAEVLEHTQTVRPGMSRAELLEVFTGEGGISTRLHRTYVYRGCPYFKVDVEFDPIGGPGALTRGDLIAPESLDDQIRTISRPYLQWRISD